MKLPLFCLALSLGLPACPAPDEPGTSPSTTQIDSIYSHIENQYMDLHRNPELSNQEHQTADRFASELTRLGFEVRSGFQGTGVIGILRNGEGRAIMIRAELDALAILEQTALPYASKAVAHDSAGATIPLMHACGHDMHMAVAIGTAELLARNKESWSGTLMVVGQPAEETGPGAASHSGRPVHQVLTPRCRSRAPCRLGITSWAHRCHSRFCPGRRGPGGSYRVRHSWTPGYAPNDD